MGALKLNIFWEEKGAFTGEVSAAQLKDLGVEYVIVGHSERRVFFGESDDTIHQRLIAALQSGLRVIFCCGETLDARESHQTEVVIDRQLKIALADVHLQDPEDLVIAYEPVWAIGTGHASSFVQAQEVHSVIRSLLKKQFGGLATEIRIQYGGSVKPDNIRGFLAERDIDGVLVGGASLDPLSFAQIVDAGFSK